LLTDGGIFVKRPLGFYYATRGRTSLKRENYAGFKKNKNQERERVRKLRSF
jgi:hypothetical protein